MPDEALLNSTRSLSANSASLLVDTKCHHTLMTAGRRHYDMTDPHPAVSLQDTLSVYAVFCVLGAGWSLCSWLLWAAVSASVTSVLGCPPPAPHTTRPLLHPSSGPTSATPRLSRDQRPVRDTAPPAQGRSVCGAGDISD